MHFCHRAKYNVCDGLECSVLCTVLQAVTCPKCFVMVVMVVVVVGVMIMYRVETPFTIPQFMVVFHLTFSHSVLIHTYIRTYIHTYIHSIDP